MKKTLLLLVSFLWLGASYFITQIVDYQGKMIGGSKYFAHVGIKSGVNVEYGLAVTALLVLVLLWATALTKLQCAGIAAVLSFAFSIVVTYTYLPVFAPALGKFAYIPLGVFPPELKWFPLGAFVLGLFTAFLCSISRTLTINSTVTPAGARQ